MKRKKMKVKEVSHAPRLNPATPKRFGVWKGDVELPAKWVGMVLDTASVSEARRKFLETHPNYKAKVFIRELGEREFPKGRNFGYHPKGRTDNPEWVEWQRRLRAGIQRDLELVAALKPYGGHEDQMSEKSKKSSKGDKSEKSTKSEKTVKKGGASGEHKDWNGHGMCELIRYAGKRGFGKNKTLKLMQSLGLEPNPATVSIQLRKGKNDEGVPTLGKEHRAEFDSIASDIPNDEKVKKSDKSNKTAKAEKKSTKKSGKKKRHHDDDAEEAEAQAEADADEDTEEEDAEVAEEVEA